MNEICQGNGIQFVVIMIPTKESVFSRYIEHNSNISMSETNDQVIEKERIARKTLHEYFAASKIKFFDPLGKMEEAIDREKLYAASAVDMHPNKNGYRVIAEAVSGYLLTADQVK